VICRVTIEEQLSSMKPSTRRKLLALAYYLAGWARPWEGDEMADTGETAATLFFRGKFENCARRYHDLLRGEASPSHRYWKFENCPADTCKDAREALGLPVGGTMDLAASPGAQSA
jgi:hypothetical protein